ncbi:hypothetical protein JWG44_10755 [Leptospira sp. 201903071]|uniref:hypothetical protein n=1 Tax=Leptospira ainazelensis TaxID=2810034 RepID=UPI001963F717|nr:hypothetical protein [Leptospira ainazelensis]MBM9500725.1 hypothetical protein [Leptospira ainazelensis]
MKNRNKVAILILFILLFLNCSIGTARDACKNNLKKGGIFDASDDSCNALQLLLASPLGANATAEANQSREARISFQILNCYQYYEKLKECNKEVKKYLPAIYSKE